MGVWVGVLPTCQVSLCLSLFPLTPLTQNTQQQGGAEPHGQECQKLLSNMTHKMNSPIYGSNPPETIDELIDTNPKCRLFFKIDLQE